MLITESYSDEIKTTYGLVRTHIFTPTMPGWENKKPKFPAVVVFSEIYNVTEPIRRFCRMVAGRGFLVAAPEIFHDFEAPGTAIPYDDEGTERGNRYKIEKELQSYDQDRLGVLDFLMKHPQCTGHIGSVGICIGGHLAYRSALDSRIKCAVLIEPTDIHAASLAKGKNDDSLKRVNDIKAELLCIFGHLDNHIPLEGRTKLRNALNEAGITHSWLELAWVQHAYIRDELSKGRYDSAAARVTFELMFDLFFRKLYIEGAGSGAKL